MDFSANNIVHRRHGEGSRACALDSGGEDRPSLHSGGNCCRSEYRPESKLSYDSRK